MSLSIKGKQENIYMIQYVIILKIIRSCHLIGTSWVKLFGTWILL